MKRILFIHISEGNVPEVFVQWTRSNIDRCQDWPWSGWWCWLLSRESVINSLLRIPIVTRAWRIGESYFHRDATYQPRPRVRFLISPMMRVPCQRKVKAEDMRYDGSNEIWDQLHFEKKSLHKQMKPLALLFIADWPYLYEQYGKVASLLWCIFPHMSSSVGDPKIALVARFLKIGLPLQWLKVHLMVKCHHQLFLPKFLGDINGI